MTPSRRWALFLCLSLLAGALQGADDDDSGPAKLGYTGVPIVGYDDKSGWLFGGAGFAYSEADPAINAQLFAVSNLNDFHSSTFNYEQRSGDWLVSFHGLAERAFDNYYGEGDLTAPDNPYRLSIYHFEAKPGLLYRLRPHLRAGVFDDYRARLETAAERLDHAVPGDPTQVIPNESTDALGLKLEWDSRDRVLNTRSGDYHQLSLTYGPGDWTTLPGEAGFMQLQLDLRRYRPIYRHLIFASRFLGAISHGQPSYLFRYRLGGLDTMRGYKDNRFRGEDFFVFQEELRWFLKNWLSVNGSLDLGDAGDSAFHQLKVSPQLGLRVGLPPQWVQKMRIDLGYGFDQQTFQIQFGEIF